MRQDVVDLARFYATPLGAAARAMLARRIAALWPDASGLDLLGIGYAAPFVARYRETARRCVLAMPAGQGAERWPAHGKAEVALVDETALPFRESLFDRALVVHLVEDAEALRPLLRELWRVTAPEARIVVVVSNRRGLWARAETSPFGQGRSFTRNQIAATLRDAMFEPTAWAGALYMPPMPWGFVARGAAAWEGAGERLWPRFGGVILVEAVKRVVAETPKGRRRLIFAPAAQPAGPRPAWRETARNA